LTLTDTKPGGWVCLIGAGPGDPGLITAKGLCLLQRANVVVFDALVNPILLAQAPAEAQRIDVGKRAGTHALGQDQINRLLVDLANEGHLVVRLKGGDPYLFGRGAEEVAYVARCGVRCEVVPGVTAGISVPATAGIPVTHRRLASTVTFVTGHEDPAKGQPSIDYVSLAGLVKVGGTVCFYMGVERLDAIVRQLSGCGLESQTPVCVIQWGTLPRQRSVRSNLASASADSAAAGLGAPAMIVVGAVAGLDEPGLNYFMNRPLLGQRIVITRTRQQSSDLCRMFEEQGAEALIAPTIQIAWPNDWASVDQAIQRIAEFDWLILTSTNSVVVLAGRLEAMELDARHLGAVKLAAVGDATASLLRQRIGVRADLIPNRFVAESLAESLVIENDMSGRRLLLLRADIAKPILPRLLTDAGAIVTEVTAYHTKSADKIPSDVKTALKNGEVDWVTFTSASTADHMAQLLGPDRALLRGVKIASIGPVTSQALRRLDLEPTVEAATSNSAGLVAAVVAASNNQAHG